MAAGRLWAPGTKLGPCKEPCEHRDCAESRRQAAAPCSICGEPIGYERAFYQEDDWTVFHHAVCLEDKTDRERKVPGT